MSSPFQSAMPAELPSNEEPQQQQATEKHPHQNLIDQTTALIMVMGKLPEDENEKPKFLWKFLSSYITLLEQNKHYIVPTMSKAYPDKVKVTDEVVVSLLSIKKPSNTRELI